MTEPIEELGRLEGVRVLVVDDDPDIRETMEMAFEAEGADTLGVGDGNTAIQICHDDPPDLVVLDMMLPGRSGLLALERIKGRHDSPAVIMVTANEGKRHKDYAQSMGVDAYLQKPVPLDQLIALAEQLLAGRPRAADRVDDGVDDGVADDTGPDDTDD